MAILPKPSRPKRLRVPANDPNCVERAALYPAAAELIDPSPTRQFAAARTPGGLHTYPLEDGAPVVLGPLVSRNALMADLFRSTQARNGDGSIAIALHELIDWISDMCESRPAGFRAARTACGTVTAALCSLLGGLSRGRPRRRLRPRGRRPGGAPLG